MECIDCLACDDNLKVQLPYMAYMIEWVRVAKVRRPVKQSNLQLTLQGKRFV